MRNYILMLCIMLAVMQPVFAAPAPVPAPGNKAYEAYQSEQYVKAAEMFDTPYEQGVSYYRAGQFNLAERAFLKVTDAEKKISATYNLGNTHFQLKDYKQAKTAYEQVLQSEAEHEDAVFNLALANKLIEAEEEKKKEQEEKEQQKQEQEEEQEKESEEQKSGGESSEESESSSSGEEESEESSSGESENESESAGSDQSESKGDADSESEQKDESTGSDKSEEESDKPDESEQKDESAGSDKSEKQDQSAQGQEKKKDVGDESDKDADLEKYEAQSEQIKDLGALELGEEDKPSQAGENDESEAKPNPDDLSDEMIDQWLKRVEGDSGRILRYQFMMEEKRQAMQSNMTELRPW
jgi:Ca-activated chloride channel homolog